jgi:hypothetical protein
MKSKAQAKKAKIKKCSMKPESFCTYRKINKMKRQPLEWETIFANICKVEMSNSIEKTHLK